ncbi:MAG TPA: ABC transporter permease [Tepidisphaeraceae bacterium]|nr:ABC transporter permease [Tepidisphaeraceae bacterium]
MSPNASGAGPPFPYAAPTATGQTWTTILTKLGPLIGLSFVVGLFSVLTYNTFFTLGNFELILRQTAVVGIAALGMTMIIIAGGIDLSVGSAIAVVCVTVALLLPHELVDPGTGARVLTGGIHPVLAALGGIAAGIMIGCLNGALTTGLRLAPFIITLGMMSLLRGTAQEWANNTMVYPRQVGFLDELLQPIDAKHLWLLTPGVWLMLLLALVVSGVLRYTRFGRYIFAIGSNEQTARLCGVPVERTKLLVYAFAGALFAVAGILQFSYLGMGDPTTAVGMELDIIAAVVIGGASLAGGQGTILGSLVGALIMTVVANGCSKMGWPNSRQLIVTGVIIILAVALDRLRHRKRTAAE